MRILFASTLAVAAAFASACTPSAEEPASAPVQTQIEPTMKVRSSLKSLKTRHRDCKVVRRKGVVFVINKTDPRFKAKQG